jgi:hypothetical protein
MGPRRPGIELPVVGDPTPGIPLSSVLRRRHRQHATAACSVGVDLLDPVVSRDNDGGLVIDYEARIDGFGEGRGVATIESSSAEQLRCLAMVADFLAERGVVVSRDERCHALSERSSGAAGSCTQVHLQCGP